MTRLPDFIIIGAMKCATSTVHDQLARLDGIHMSEPKEPNFFSNDEEYERGMDWYHSLFATADRHTIKGESSTHYTKLPTYPLTLGRMHAVVPDARLIYIMRHPVDRLVSHYIHEWTERTINIPINEAVLRFPRLIDYSRYAMQLQPYLQYYPTDRILPVFFESLIADPQPEFERICRFIGYDQPAQWDSREDQQNVSSQRLRKSAWRDALVWSPALSWVRRHFVPQSLRNRVKKMWQMHHRPELSPPTQKELVSVFDDDLAILGNWFGMPLTCENFKSVVTRSTPQWSHEISKVSY